MDTWTSATRRSLVSAAVASAVACFVDDRMTPARRQPGDRRRLSRPPLAPGLATGALARRGDRFAGVGMIAGFAPALMGVAQLGRDRERGKGKRRAGEARGPGLAPLLPRGRQ